MSTIPAIATMRNTMQKPIRSALMPATNSASTVGSTSTESRAAGMTETTIKQAMSTNTIAIIDRTYHIVVVVRANLKPDVWNECGLRAAV